MWALNCTDNDFELCCGFLGLHDNRASANRRWHFGISSNLCVDKMTSCSVILRKTESNNGAWMHRCCRFCLCLVSIVTFVCMNVYWMPVYDAQILCVINSEFPICGRKKEGRKEPSLPMADMIWLACRAQSDLLWSWVKTNSACTVKHAKCHKTADPASLSCLQQKEYKRVGELFVSAIASGIKLHIDVCTLCWFFTSITGINYNVLWHYCAEWKIKPVLQKASAGCKA